MRSPSTLRTRLFSWFFAAIVLAVLTTSLVGLTTRPEPVTGAEVMARNVSERLASDWDDPPATRRYVEEVRDVTGFEVRLVREARRLPPRVRKAVERGRVIVNENPDHIFVPVARGGTLLGALEMEKFGPRVAPWGWWRFTAALVLVLAVLSLMAGRVANLLARPLEQLALAADRVGSGDLAFRAKVGPSAGWVAREVGDVAVSFNRMAGRVEAMVRGQRELLGAISHELRSPLTRARIALEMARDRCGSQAWTARSPLESIDDVDRELAAVDGILRDLLDVTRAGLADLRKQTRPVVEWLRTCAVDHAVVFRVDPEVERVVLAFDAPLLGRAVHNLLVNAEAHGHPAGEPLEVAVAREGERLRVAVRDRGEGFAEGFAERAFEPFVRGDAARTRPHTGGGYGLGLAIVRRIVEAHGGAAFAGNVREGERVTGAEVGFELPLDAPPR